MNTRDLRINDSIEVNSKINKVCKENACDPFGNILREEFSSGLVVTSSYDDYSRPVQRILPDDSQILYAYEGPFLKTVTRLDSRGSQLYSHTYEEFDEKGNPLFETGLFSTSYSYDKEGRRIFQKNPYFAIDQGTSSERETFDMPMMQLLNLFLKRANFNSLMTTTTIAHLLMGKKFQ